MPRRVQIHPYSNSVSETKETLASPYNASLVEALCRRTEACRAHLPIGLDLSALRHKVGSPALDILVQDIVGDEHPLPSNI